MTRLKGPITACMLALLLVPKLAGADEPVVAYSTQLTLPGLVEQVYQRLPDRLAEGKYQQLQQANDRVASALFAEPATASISHFNDALGSSDGFQEWEGGVTLPLWLPGQKRQQHELSTRIAAELPAYQSRLRLQAAAQVRELIWQIRLAEVGVEQARLALASAERIERDVGVRVEAGDLPKTERLLASTNSSEARAQLGQAQAHLQQALAHYQLVTGEHSLPAEHAEIVSPHTSIDARHPQLQLQDQVIDRLRAEVGLAHYDGAVNPSLSVGMRRERGESGERFNNSVGVGISFALGDARYRQPAIARAAAELADAEVERQSGERLLQTRLLQVEQSLRAKQAALKLVTEQDKTTRQYVALQQRAFDLGEINLMDLLRSQALANESSSRKRQLEVEIQQKIAEKNQALGLLPE